MAPLAVDPEILDGAGAAVISVGEGLGSTISTLTTSLGGCHGMSGDDPAGAAFGHSYDNSASKMLEAMVKTRNGLCRLGDGVRVSAHNYALAEANSNIAGHRDTLPGAHPTGAISAASTPSSVGHGVSTPPGWGWVSKYIGMIWPSGNSAQLRGAAAAWAIAGTNFEVSEITGTVGPMGSIGAQQIPELPAIAAAFTETHRCAAAILQQCATIATQLTSYATKIDTVHAAILDLLSRICNPMTGLKIVLEFLTDDDEDEIRKIANDIRTIVHQFTAEVDALRRQIAKAITEATTIVSTMVRYAEKEWDHFLHTTDAGRMLDHFGQICSGVVSEAESTVKGMWNLNPLRAVVDPKGFWHSVSGALENLEALTGLEGEQKLEESWKGLSKGVVHWDEWAANPFKAAGETLFDGATLLLPGGALSKLPTLGRAAAEVAEAPRVLRLPNPGRLPNPAPHDDPPPRNDPPKGGQAGSAPKTKDPLPPYGLTEPKAPAEPKPPTTAPKHVVEPAAPSGHSPSPTPDRAGPEHPGGSPAPLPNGPAHGGTASPHQPPSLTHDHHGPVAHLPEPLSPQELSALADYTGLGHEDLNTALRDGSVDASQLARIEALNSALEKLPAHEGPVFRGTNLPPEVLAQYQPGAIVTESGFLSTSRDLTVAQSEAFAGNVEFRIMSKSGRDISSLSVLPDEQEVLFHTDVPFYVVDRRIDPSTGITVIEMIEQ
jgi:hypothetical protein